MAAKRPVTIFPKIEFAPPSPALNCAATGTRAPMLIISERLANNMHMETDKAKGKLKQAAGALTGDKDLKRDGKIDEKAGQAKQAVGRAKNKLSDTVHKARDEKK